MQVSFPLPIVVAPYGGFNSYFPLPFRKKARITITNEHPDDIHSFFYTVNYCLTGKLPDEVAYFHAQWRREKITTLKKDYTIVDGIRGRGQYVGRSRLDRAERYWWGEGEIKGYIDGDEEYPTYCGTGVEDYFGGAWGFHEQDELGRQQPTETTYNSPFLGYPFYSKTDLTRPEAFGYDVFLDARSVPLAYHGPDPFRAGPPVDDPADRLRRRQDLRAFGRCRFYRILVSERAPRSVPDFSRSPGTMAPLTAGRIEKNASSSGKGERRIMDKRYDIVALGECLIDFVSIE